MTGKELKQFVSDQGWPNDEAIEVFGISLGTLYRQYKKDEVSEIIAIICNMKIAGMQYEK